MIKEDAFIFMVLGFGEIDFANMLSAKCKQQGTGKWKLDAGNPVENAWLSLYWLSRVSSILICGSLHHILEAVKTIHEERIVHSDLKPANFSLVKGELKLIDFGITKAGQNYTTNIVWESQMGIVKYMSLEAYLNNTTNDSGNKSKIA
jgi:serine/threonine-protein kinase TTK/MPS1